MRRIIIVEDDLELRQELKLLLDNNGYEGIILEAFDDAKNRILQENPELILLDIHIPNLNGEYLLKEIRKESEVPVIMVTSSNNELDEVVSMSFGADDYITKPYNPTILLLRIEAIFKRIYKNHTIIPYRNIKLNISKGVIATDKEEILLSKNELKIFSFLLTHHGQIVSRDDIINYLWDTETFVDDNTLTVNMSRLRHKLEEIGLKDVIETKRGSGYLLL